LGRAEELGGAQGSLSPYALQAAISACHTHAREAREEFERAAALAQNARQRDRLLQRAAACQG
jgi:predicted RNA polymerase sigma factor